MYPWSVCRPHTACADYCEKANEQWPSKTGSSPVPACRASRTRSVTLDDKMTFFQQLSTLVSLGHAAVAGDPDFRRAEPEPETAPRAGADRRPRVGRQLAARRRRQLSADLPAPLDRSHPHRRNHRANGAGAPGTQQADPRVPRDPPQSQRRPDVSDHPHLSSPWRRHRSCSGWWCRPSPRCSRTWAPNCRASPSSSSTPPISSSITDSTCVGGIVAIVLAFRQYLKTEAGRRRVGGIGLALPLVGDLIVQSAMYRFASNSPCC